MSRNFLVPRDGSLSDGVVVLRGWRPDDAAALVRCLDGDPAVTRYIPMIPQPYDEEAERSFLADAERRNADGSGWHLAVADATTGALLGGIDVRWNESGDVGEVGYWTSAAARGRGVTTRALVLLSRYALRQEGVGRLQLRAEPENLASCRVAEKAGFRREGILRSSQWNERLGRRVDLAMYSLLPADLE